MLNHNEKLVLIDLSQATTNENPNYEVYWKRDILNVVKYFQKIRLIVNEEIIKRIS